MEGQKIQISFIIPAYNAEHTLEEAVRSIAGSLPASAEENPIEILIVENGSEDRTTEMAEKLRDTLSDRVSILVLHSEKGVSSARNLGIEHASGRYLFFLDADDRLADGALQILTEDAEKNDGDLLLYSYEKGDSPVRITEQEKRYGRSHITEGTCRMMENPTRYLTVWAKLFRREIIAKHDLRFPADLRFSEDSIFVLQYCRFCSTIVMSETITYHYSVTGPSAVRTYDGAKVKEYMRSLRAAEKIVPKENPRIRHSFAVYALMQLNLMMVREVFSGRNPAPFRKKVRRLRRLTEGDGIFAPYLRQIRACECRSMRMIPVLLLKLHLYDAAGRVYQVRAHQNESKENKEG